MERTLSVTTHDEEEKRRLAYWLSRPPEERIAEVERLRREYYSALGRTERDALSRGLHRTLRLVDRDWC